MTAREHAHLDKPRVNCAVITISDSRTPETDVSGATIRELVQGDGHRLTAYDILPDDPERVIALVRARCDDTNCDFVLITGGSGVGPRDTTIEALEPLFEKELPGFGELFRHLSYREIGPAAMLSRAVAGVYRRTGVFVLPGSPAAVRLAMKELILPTVSHLTGILAKR